MNFDKEKSVEACNRMVRGEISAIETYEQAIRSLGENEPEVKLLKGIQAEHGRNADLLQKNIVLMGETPDTESGVWGNVVKVVEGGATLFGKKATLKALKQGELIGEKQYEEVMSDPDIYPECKALVRKNLLPTQRQNIGTLQELGA